KSNIKNIKELELDEEDIKSVYNIGEDKYKKIEWTYGKTPKFQVVLPFNNESKINIHVNRWKVSKFFISYDDNVINMDKLLDLNFFKEEIKESILENYPHYIDLINLIF
ncbi:TPA: lipoate--protein ligase, partial [Clostridioides difficile]|nr:lipoate--protein ligase [Clostridioides difficile]